MDTYEFIAECQKDAAEQLGVDKLSEIIRRAYEQDRREPREIDWAKRDADRRRKEIASENAYNCPRGERK